MSISISFLRVDANLLAKETIVKHLRKLFMVFKNSLGRVLNVDCSGAGEPMDHPAFASMTQRELADLPMPNFMINSEGKLIQVIDCAGGAGLISRQT